MNRILLLLLSPFWFFGWLLVGAISGAIFGVLCLAECLHEGWDLWLDEWMGALPQCASTREPEPADLHEQGYGHGV